MSHDFADSTKEIQVPWRGCRTGSGASDSPRRRRPERGSIGAGLPSIRARITGMSGECVKKSATRASANSSSPRLSVGTALVSRAASTWSADFTPRYQARRPAANCAASLKACRSAAGRPASAATVAAMPGVSGGT